MERKILTRTELYTILNLRNQGLNVLEIEILTGLSIGVIKNAFNNADRLMDGERICIR